MRTFAVIGSGLALLAGRTAVPSTASASASPRKLLASAWKVAIDLGKNPRRPGGQVPGATVERQGAETPRLYLVETDHDEGPRARFGRQP
jgi:hypothetical protein